MNYSFFHLIVLLSILYIVNCVLFDRYSGKILLKMQAKELIVKNLTEFCAIEVKPCNTHEGSRIDGSCNNYKYPTRGSARGPYLKMLVPDYPDRYKIRMSKNGMPLPSARKVRTTLQSTGRVIDRNAFSVAAVTYLDFVNKDVSLLNGPLDYLTNRQHCCEPDGEKDPRCIPIEVPNDDPYLKVTDIRCLNFSRAESFRDAGCANEIIPLDQINFQTPLLDLSTIYGINEATHKTVRAGLNGLLSLGKRNDRYFPQKSNQDDFFYTANDHEPFYYQFGTLRAGNFDLRTTTMAIFFMREHNRIARALHEMNPCWKDDRLFKVARQINVATASHIFMYELLPSFLGYEHMSNYGLVSDRVEHISVYDGDSLPLVYAEYEIASRYYHTFLDGRIKRYDENYEHLGDFSYSKTLFQQHLLEKNNTFEEINRGLFYQDAARIDDIQDPEIAETFFDKIQRAHDLPAIDIQRGRDMGVRGYNDYREICGLYHAVSFDDFLDIMEIEKVEALKKLYKDVDDVDLLAGIMSENHIEDTFVTPTLFCIMTRQLLKFRYADRFWYERGDQSHSLNLVQLNEIKKSSIARVACDNAEGIKHIQPHAFLSIGLKNKPVPCREIPGPNLIYWKDNSCDKYNKIAVPRSFTRMDFGIPAGTPT